MSKLSDDLAAIEARVEKATKGPWLDDGLEIMQLIPHSTVPDAPLGVYPGAKTIASFRSESGGKDEDSLSYLRDGDRAFIAACPTDVPKLIAKLIAFEKAGEAMCQVVGYMKEAREWRAIAEGGLE